MNDGECRAQHIYTHHSVKGSFNARSYTQRQRQTRHGRLTRNRRDLALDLSSERIAVQHEPAAKRVAEFFRRSGVPICCQGVAWQRPHLRLLLCARRLGAGAFCVPGLRLLAHLGPFLRHVHIGLERRRVLGLQTQHTNPACGKNAFPAHIDGVLPSLSCEHGTQGCVGAVAMEDEWYNRLICRRKWYTQAECAAECD